MPGRKLYPLKFAPIYKEKVWGGRTLQILGRDLPGNDQDPIGESWELADLKETSVTGGGGGSAYSHIQNGEMKGRSLHELIKEFGQAITGSLPLTDDNAFPLLVKFLDAKTNLSVQVHPNPQYAQTHPNAHLKSECWYILHAEEDAVIYKGVKEGTTEELFRQAIENDKVEDLLITIPAKAGDSHYVPSGTCHTLGAGILAAEIQTPSDTTFRVYDWGRTGRELHIDQAMQCIKFGPADTAANEPKISTEGQYTVRTQLIKCDYFNLDRFIAKNDFTEEINESEPVVWMILEGEGHFTCDASPHVSFEKGQTLLLPPGMSNCTANITTGTTWLEVTFPQAAKDNRIA